MSSILEKYKNLKKDPKLPLKLLLNKLAPYMSDRLFLKVSFFIRTGKRLNLNDPQTFNEKLQWLKLYNRNPEYSRMVDKYEAKKYVASIIGDEHIIPTIGVYDSAEEIPWDSLPDKFVIKCTHDSGGVVICKDKNSLNIKRVKEKLSKGLKRSYFYQNREWPYKNVKPRIICEEYMVDESGYELKDYKFFCFNGVVKCLKVDFDRNIDHHANYYDVNWKLLGLGENKFPPDYTRTISKPETLLEMISFAEQLSKDFPFVRVDFYSIMNRVYFGEITFFPSSGMGLFTSNEWDCILGSWIKLPKEKLV